MNGFYVCEKAVLIIAFSILLLLPVFTLTVHAQTVGTVCISDTIPLPWCPSFQQTIGPQFPGGDATVNVANSQPFNAFAVSVKADLTILNATVSIGLVGTGFRVAGGTVNVEVVCVNGHAIVGTCRNQDGPGVVTVVASSNIVITDGRLFNITYHVLKQGTASLTYPTGCVDTSNNTVCVKLTNTSVIDPENLLGATFSTGDFSITATPSSQTVRPGLSTSYTVTVTSLNGFVGNVGLSTSVSPVSTGGPTPALNPITVNLPTSGQAMSKLTLTTSGLTPIGSYSVFVTGASCASCGLSHQSRGTSLGVQGVPIVYPIQIVWAWAAGWVGGSNSTNFSNSNPTISVFRGVAFKVNASWNPADGQTHDFAIYTAGFAASGVSSQNTCSLSNTNGCIARSPNFGANAQGLRNFNLLFAPNLPNDDFSGPGVYEYYCELHPATMHGKIVVYKNPDIDGDGRVDIVDISTIALAYGSQGTPVATPRWDPRADIDNNGTVNIVDVAIAAFYYGTSA